MRAILKLLIASTTILQPGAQANDLRHLEGLAHERQEMAEHNKMVEEEHRVHKHEHKGRYDHNKPH